VIVFIWWFFFNGGLLALIWSSKFNILLKRQLEKKKHNNEFGLKVLTKQTIYDCWTSSLKKNNAYIDIVYNLIIIFSNMIFMDVMNT
jgi:hypothetical protein